jgi:tetratricopeptide (TPR) repeat protein
MIGTLFNNRYHLDAELGQGAMGTIYRSHDDLLDRDVAIKLVNGSSLGTAGRARLLGEAKAAAKLNHPNIVSIYDAGEVDQTPFIVMELIEGDSLFDKKPQSIGEIVSVTRQICAALAHAHSHGIVHRDLKPENVILTHDGIIKLTDFGLARSVATRLSQDGTIVGTVYYIAPETVQGKAIDGRTDLYALGIMLYEWTTGTLPFVADDPLGVISQHLYAPVVPPHARNAEIPPVLDDLILRLLSKQPEDRPASAQDVEQLLATLDPAQLESSLAITHYQLDRLVRGRLVGREREMEVINAAWQRVVAGEGQVLLVSGEPGIGKTRVAHELIARAAVSGGRTYLGECYDGGGMPYAPFAQVLEESLAATPNSKSTLPDYVLTDLVKIAPVLRSIHPKEPDNLLLEPEAEQQHIFESVFAWCAALTAHQPMLLVIDDAHWADSATLFLLRFLARRARRLRLMIALTYREIELNDTGALQNILLDLAHERLADRIKLTRFDRQGTRDMLAAILTPAGKIDPTLLDAIYLETEGNPFYIEEVCKSLLQEDKICFEHGRWVVEGHEKIEIPQSVRVTIQARLARLPERAQEALRVAATIGREFDFNVLQRASDIPEDELVDLLEQAESSQIISELQRSRVGSIVFSFYHALIPTTLQEGISGLRRQRLHRRVAAALEEIHPEDYETLAFHYEEAGDAERALANYTHAAERAMEVYANQEAEHDYRAAVELADAEKERAKLLAGLGEACFRQGKYPLAEKAWRQAIDLYRSLGDLDNMSHLYARLARSAWYSSDAAACLKICREGMSRLPEGIENPGVAALLHETARACRFNDINDEALDLANKALAMSRKLGLAEVQADTLSTIGIIPDQPLENAQKALEEAAQLADSAGLLATASRAHLNLGGHLTRSGDFLPARRHLQMAVDQAQRIGNQPWEFSYLLGLANTDYFLGDFDVVREEITRLRQLEQVTPITGHSADEIKLFEALLTAVNGDFKNAVQQLLKSNEEDRKTGDTENLSNGLNQLAELLIEMDRLEEAEPPLAEVETLTGNEMRSTHLMTHLLRARIACKKADFAETKRHIQEAHSLLGQFPYPLKQIQIIFEEAKLAGAEKRWEDSDRFYQQVTKFLKKSGAQFLLAKVETEWADLYIVRGSPEDTAKAKALLQDALRFFQVKKLDYYTGQTTQRLQTLISN